MSDGRDRWLLKHNRKVGRLEKTESKDDLEGSVIELDLKFLQ